MSSKHFLIIGMFISLFFACEKPSIPVAASHKAPDGLYQCDLELQGKQLHFQFSLSENGTKMTLYNGQESFEIDDFQLTEDSLFAALHIFDTKLMAFWSQEDQSFTGYWVKNYVADYSLPFSARIKKDSLNKEAPQVSIELAPKYAVQFESMMEDSTMSVAEFVQEGSILKGTFLTTTGDYRYLNGTIEGNDLTMSTFDGEHAFLFEGKVDEKGHIEGHFYSGKTWHETWTAVPDPNAELTDAEQLTFLKEGFETVNFSGSDLSGKKMSIDNKRLKGKAIVLQIMGTWCPNCMDETAYLSHWYNNFRDSQNVEIVSLAYERKDDFWYAKTRLEKLKERYDIEYPLLVAGLYDKEKAAETLPELNDVIAYPTLIFMDSTHRVQAIHTGFMGPGTGDHFEKWKINFAKHIEEITP